MKWEFDSQKEAKQAVALAKRLPVPIRRLKNQPQASMEAKMAANGIQTHARTNQ